MPRIDGIEYREELRYRAFDSWGQAWPFVRKMEADGYRRPRTGGRHTLGVKPGKFALFFHHMNVWVFWWPKEEA